MNNTAELLRLIHNLIRFGTIAEVDLDAAHVRVTIGELKTGWLKWAAGRAGDSIEWDPPSEGEQVLLLAPGGDLNGALVFPAAYQQSYPAPSNKAGLWRRVFPDDTVFEYDSQTGIERREFPDGAVLTYNRQSSVWRNEFPDGAVIEYDSQAKHLLADLPGTTEITAPNGATINADLTLNGSLTIDGNSVTHNGKNIGMDHKHKDVQPGSGLSGDPV